MNRQFWNLKPLTRGSGTSLVKNREEVLLFLLYLLQHTFQNAVIGVLQYIIWFKHKWKEGNTDSWNFSTSPGGEKKNLSRSTWDNKPLLFTYCMTQIIFVWDCYMYLEGLKKYLCGFVIYILYVPSSIFVDW